MIMAKINQLALIPPKPISTVPTAPIKVRVEKRKIINDVIKPTWLGTGTGKRHAFAVAEGAELSGTVKTVCGRSMDAGKLSATDGDRCKSCNAAFPPEIRYGKGLSEPTVDVVHHGAQQGAPRSAEAKRVAELAPISGDAAIDNAKIAQAARTDKRGAQALARKLDRRGPAADVPAGPSLGARQGVSDHRLSGRTAGQRGEARMDGVALVRGRSMEPKQPMRKNRKTGEMEISSRGTMGGPLGKERLDSSVQEPRDKGRFTKSQRRNWQRKQQRIALAELRKGK